MNSLINLKKSLWTCVIKNRILKLLFQRIKKLITKKCELLILFLSFFDTFAKIYATDRDLLELFDALTEQVHKIEIFKSIQIRS